MPKCFLRKQHLPKESTGLPTAEYSLISSSKCLGHVEDDVSRINEVTFDHGSMFNHLCK